MKEPVHLGDVLKSQARIQPDRIGARDLERHLSFRDWNERACRLGNALLALGLKKGERIAILAYNRLEWAEIYAGFAKAGVIAVPINFWLTTLEVAFICKGCGVSAVIAETALLPVIEPIRHELGIDDPRFILIGPDQAGWRSYKELIAGGSPKEPAASVAADDPWCLMYTSGTTGKPKLPSFCGMAPRFLPKH
jgi:fatty-acyl-CoA synthase